MRSVTVLAPILSALIALQSTSASPAALQGTKTDSAAAYGKCQTGCNRIAVACYKTAGYTFGTVLADDAAPPVILACNKALGSCSSACASATLPSPTSSNQ